jgi:hypothetical protein
MVRQSSEYLPLTRAHSGLFPYLGVFASFFKEMAADLAIVLPSFVAFLFSNLNRGRCQDFG